MRYFHCNTKGLLPEGYYNNIYIKRKLDQDKTKPMRKIILDASEEWRANKPYVGREIINQVIDTIKIEEMKD